MAAGQEGGQARLNKEDCPLFASSFNVTHEKVKGPINRWGEGGKNGATWFYCYLFFGLNVTTNPEAEAIKFWVTSVRLVEESARRLLSLPLTLMILGPPLLSSHAVSSAQYFSTKCNYIPAYWMWLCYRRPSAVLSGVQPTATMSLHCTSLISLILEPPLPIREPHWLAGTTSLRVTGGLLVAGLLLMELMMS